MNRLLFSYLLYNKNKNKIKYYIHNKYLLKYDNIFNKKIYIKQFNYVLYS